MESVSFPTTLWSLLLIAIAVGLSLWLRLGVEGSILWAALRAAAQLLAVGAVFRLIFESAQAPLWSALWIVGMVAVATGVAAHRAGGVRGVWRHAAAAIGASTGIALAVVFGFGIIAPTPVDYVVVAGITIGNTMPATVLAIDRAMAYFIDHPGRVETLLALGFDGRSTARFIAPLTARTALIPQIERTKVVGLIALPGAMTGLLLAGVDPMDAVLVQLVVMYLILGAVAVSVSVVTAATLTRAFSDELRLPEWARGN